MEVAGPAHHQTGSAPAPTVSLTDFGEFGPQGEILSRLFEICRRLRQVPQSWRHSRVILIPKDRDGDMADVSNWRPIALADAV